MANLGDGDPKRPLSPADFPAGPLTNILTAKRKIKKKSFKSPLETQAYLILDRIQQDSLRELKTQSAAMEKRSKLPSMLGKNSLTRFETLQFYPYSILNGLEGDSLTQEAEDEFEKLWDKVEQITNSAIEKELMLLQESDDDLYLRNLLQKLKEKKEKEAKGPATATATVLASTSSSPVSVPPLASASEDVAPLFASISEATEFLVSLLHIGSLCRRKSERACIIRHNPEITHEKLVEVSNLCLPLSGRSNPYLSSTKAPIDKRLRKSSWVKGKEPTIRSTKKQSKETSYELVNVSLRNCIEKVRLVENRPDLKKLVEKIIASEYMETDGHAVIDYMSAIIGILWDLENLPIPNDRDPSNLVYEIGSLLKNFGYSGDCKAYGYGNMVQLGLENFEKLVGTMDLIHVPPSFEDYQGKGGHVTKKAKKDTSDKKIIPSSLTWAWRTLLRLQEPQVIVLCSDDVDFLPTIEEVIHMDFHVLVFRKEKDNKIIARTSTRTGVWSDVTDRLPLKLPLKPV